jgi:hypothetical protein
MNTGFVFVFISWYKEPDVLAGNNHKCGTMESRHTAKRSAQKPVVQRTSFSPGAYSLAYLLAVVFTRLLIAHVVLWQFLERVK